VYCGERESTTPDHVWGRGFCLEQYRDNLPQVPACGKCNGEKSTLEHYLMTVLPFGCQHRDSQATLKTLVPKRLEKNAKLFRELQIGYIGDNCPCGRIRSSLCSSTSRKVSSGITGERSSHPRTVLQLSLSDRTVWVSWGISSPSSVPGTVLWETLATARCFIREFRPPIVRS
jgi:hypothetical protein